MPDPAESSFVQKLCELRFLLWRSGEVESGLSTFFDGSARPLTHDPGFIWLIDEERPHRAITMAWDDHGRAWYRMGIVDLRPFGFTKLDEENAQTKN